MTLRFSSGFRHPETASLESVDAPGGEYRMHPLAPLHPRIEELLDYLDTQREALRSAVDAVPSEKRGEPPAPGRWSVNGVLEHLAIVETRLTGLFNTRVAAARAAGIGDDLDTSPILPSFGPGSLVLDRSKRILASEQVYPTSDLSSDAAWAAVETSRRALQVALRNANGLALGEIVHPHPVFGPLHLYHWVAFIGGHEARHTAQIREIAAREART
jgi:hypothetical protein